MKPPRPADVLAPPRPPDDLPVRVHGERRPFQQIGGPVEMRGDERVARLLADALRLRVPRRAEASERLTHGFHTYPARMHPETARRLVRTFGVPAAPDAGRSPGPSRAARDQTPSRAARRAAATAAAAGPVTILDPFCGSGTIVVEALVAGARVLGRDASPLAVRIARTKTWLPGRARLRAMEDAAARMAAETLEHVRLRRRFPGPRPRDADWFPAHVVHELAWLRAGVAAVQDAEMREVLELCLSSILVKVSRRASDTDERVRERKVTPGAASRLLAARAAELAERLRALAADVAVGGDGGRAPVAAPPTPQLTVGDARNLAGIEDLSVDAILTSPPYPNTYDYLDLQRLRLRWLELDAGLLAETEIGARRLFKTPNAGLKRWDRDGERWVAEVARVLKPGGWCVVLMGDGMVGATVIRADESLVSWARRAGLAVVAVAAQERPQLEFRMRRAYGKGSRLEILAALRRG